jgi:hypothetical protein
MNTPRKEGWRTAFAPATVANFGSGFDAFAAAIAAEVRPWPEGEQRVARPAARPFARPSRRYRLGPSIEAIGRARPRDRGGRGTAAARRIAQLRRRRGRRGPAPRARAVRLDLVLRKGLPLSSGMGSSAASAAAGRVRGRPRAPGRDRTARPSRLARRGRSARRAREALRTSTAS